MDRSQRWGALLDVLGRTGRLSVASAAEQLGVSEATVRRDFAALAEQQLVTRTHGGVVAAQVAYDLPAQYRGGSPSDARERIAAAACDLLEGGTVVGFNGGTTTSAVARRLAARTDLTGTAERPGLTVVTNALNIAGEMVLRPHIRTVTLGGVARPHSYELVGPLAAMVLDQLWIDVLVLGADGFDLASGPSTHHDSEAGVNAHLVRRSDRVVLVVGSEKLGVRTFARICDTDRVDVLVTDDAADPEVVAGVRGAGVEVVLA
ncbi:DeoR/GlpR family DNA-binding transcription regulator [Thalassiella azotivora]